MKTALSVLIRVYLCLSVFISGLYPWPYPWPLSVAFICGLYPCPLSVACLRDDARAWLSLDVAADGDQAVRLARGEHAVAEIADLGVEVRVGQRPLDAAEGVFDELPQPAPVLQGNRRPRLRLADRRIQPRRTAIAARDHRRLAHPLVGKLPHPGRSRCDRDRRGEVD